MEIARPPIEQQVTFIYANEPARSWAFYGELLGLALVLDQGACRIYRAAGDAFLGVCRRGKQQPAPAGVILTLVTPEVDAWYRYLQAKGAALDYDPLSRTAIFTVMVSSMMASVMAVVSWAFLSSSRPSHTSTFTV